MGLSLLASILITTLVVSSAFAKDTEGYSPAAQRLFNMVGDCPAGGSKNLTDKAELRQKTQLRETQNDNQPAKHKEESIYDMERKTENRCK